MRVGRAISGPFRRRGGILFEIVLAVALFAGAAAYTLASVRSVFSTLDQTRRRQGAVDLARSKLAELEAGLINIADLRSGLGATTIDLAEQQQNLRKAGQPSWTFALKTSRTEFTGLSLVELTVREDASGDESGTVSYTLRQLMPLREIDPEAYERDDLLEGLGDE
jgi:hypothetical protein